MGRKLLVGVGALILFLPSALLAGFGALIVPGTTGLVACLYPQTSDIAPGSARDVRGENRDDLGILPVVRARTGVPYVGRVTMATANLPTTHPGPGSLPTVPGSLRAITAQRPDFIALNEVARATPRFLARHAQGYGVSKGTDGSPPNSRRARNRPVNAVMWDASAWELVDSGQFRFVEDDMLVFRGHRVNWTRHAVWTVLKHRTDGGQVVAIAAHHMTNPERWRRTHGDYPWPSRVAQYEYGMKLLRQLVARLSAYGPVLLAGDMNVHPRQGSWSAPDQMADAGFRYVYGGAVMYQFVPASAAVLRTRRVRVSSDHPHALVTTVRLTVPHTEGARASTGAPVASTALPEVRGFTREQVRNAAAIVATGSRLGVPMRGVVIGLMTAYGESGLRNLDHGDRDSIGLFQQRNNGAWGSTSDRMTPATAATNFFKALLGVRGWQQMTPTLAAHAVQRNAVPGYYRPFWPLAQRLYAALEDVRGLPSTGTEAAGCPAPGLLTAPAAGDGSFTASGIPYVGPFGPKELMARAQAFVAARTYDPYFHTVRGSWYRQCQHFAANLSGRAYSGFATAALGWAHFVATGAAHPASAADGHSPPVGAWLYFKGSDAAGHVTVYLGQGLSASTDLPSSGRIGIVPVTAPMTEWNQTYLGWAAPWATPGTGSRPMR